MTLQTIPTDNFEKMLRAYLTEATDYDIKKISWLHQQHSIIQNHITEQRIIEVKRVSKVCPICSRNHNEIKSRVTAQQIEDIIVDMFKIDRTLLYKKTRHRVIAFPRQLCMFLIREHTNYTYLMTGLKYNRDHTTAIHSIQTIKDLIESDPQTAGIVHEIEDKLFKQ